MKSNSSLMMNWATSDTIAAAMQVMTFFFEDNMCERAFSGLTNMKTKYRSRLNIKSDLRVCLSQIAPRIDEFCKVKQAYSSH